MGFSVTSSNSMIRKNNAKLNKHVDKNLKSGIIEFFSTIPESEVMGSLIVVSVTHNHWHPSKPLLDDPILFRKLL